MWLLSQIQLLTLLSYTALGLYILARNPYNQLNRSLATFFFCQALWSSENFFYTIPGFSANHLRIINTIGATGWLGMSPAFLWFTLSFTRQNKSLKNIWILRIVTLFAAVLLTTQFFGLLISKYALMNYGWFTLWNDNIWVYAFFIYYPTVFAYALLLLFRYYQRSADITRKRQAKLLLIFAVLGLSLVSATDVIASILDIRQIPPVGNVLCLIWAGHLGYSIAKHQFLLISPTTAAENIINNMSDLLILTDTEGYVVRVNQAAETTLGMGRYNLEGRHISEVITQADKAQHSSKNLQEIENQRLELKTKAGQSIPTILSRSEIKDHERPLGYVFLIKDISRLQHVVNALKTSETRYKKLIETINEVVFSLNAQGRITYLSPSFETMTGLKATDTVGKQFQNLIHPNDHELLSEEMTKLFNGNISITRYRLLIEKKLLCWVQASCKPLIVNDRVIGVNGILTDITAQVQAQEEKKALMVRLARAEKMEAIGTLAGAVAHDLNNVLSGVVSYPDLLLQQLPDNSRLKRMATTIKNSGQKAAAIVEDLLTLSRRGVITTEVVNMNQIITDYLSSAEYNNLSACYPTARVDIDLSPDLNCIMGSPLHLDKTFMNLMVNAFEALPPEGGHIKIQTQNGYLEKPNPLTSDNPHSHDWVILKIKDTGVGIAAEDQERIFEPFFTRKVMGRSGTGLGMAVVWGAVQDHNGHVDLQSHLGEGTEFTLYFPATKQKAAPLREKESIDTYLGQGESVLVVDDVSTQLEIASDILSRLNYTVYAVSSGLAAVEFLKATPVALVILDMIMDPGIDGLDTYRQIAQIAPHQKVIIASGYSKHARIYKAIEEGVIACIKKPYLTAEMGAAIKAALKNDNTNP